MQINEFEVKFDFCNETKNNYVFSQQKSKGKINMYPPKIYLNKELFGNKEPVGIIVYFKGV